MKIRFLIYATSFIIASLFDSCSGNSSTSKTDYSVFDDKIDVPSWIIGLWGTSTPYGEISYEFNTNGVVMEKMGGEQSFGTYTYNNGVIDCRFKNSGGTVTSINIDFESKRLDIGDGYYMKKRN